MAVETYRKTSLVTAEQSLPGDAARAQATEVVPTHRHYISRDNGTRMDGKKVTVFTENEETIAFRWEDSETLRHLGVEEFHRRFYLSPPPADAEQEAEAGAMLRGVEALYEELDKANQRIAELEAERQWQPISTAPRDKTHIIIAVPTKERDAYIVGQAYFDPEPDDGAEEGEWWWANTAAGNYFDSSINEGNWHLPTQWQPLPPAPLPVSGEA